MVLLVYSKFPRYPIVHSDRASPNEARFSSSGWADQDSMERTKPSEQRAGFLKFTSWVFSVPSCWHRGGLQSTGTVITHRTLSKQYPEFHVCVLAPKDTERKYTMILIVVLSGLLIMGNLLSSCFSIFCQFIAINIYSWIVRWLNRYRDLQLSRPSKLNPLDPQ